MGMMSVRLGVQDVARSGAFYDATFEALGWKDSRVEMGGHPLALYRLPNGIHFMVGPPANGQPANHGNGETFGFTAPDAQAVDRWHAAGLAAGGTTEGDPGVRAQAAGRYGAYLRDPDGHKLCAYTAG